MNSRSDIAGSFDIGYRTNASSAVEVALCALGVCVATAAGNAFGGVVQFPQTGAAILFPPYAILAAALLLTPPRHWWAYVFASFIGHMSLDVIRPGDAPLTFVASTELANVSRALAAAIAWRSFRDRIPTFDTLENTAVFLAVAGVLAPAVGASVGAALVVIQDRAGPGPLPYLRVWKAWFISNAIVGITLLPLILIAAVKRHSWPRDASRQRVVEAVLLSIGVLVTSAVALLGGTHGVAARVYAPLPFLLWAAVRFGMGAATAAHLVVAAAAITGVFTSRGPFAMPSDDGVLSFYLFLGFTSLPCLLLAALVQEREEVLSALRGDVIGRQRAQAALEESEERIALAASSASLGFWAWTITTDVIWLSDHAKRLLGVSPDTIPSRERMEMIVHPDERDRMRFAWGRAMGYRGLFEDEWRIVRPGGDTRWISVKGRMDVDDTGNPIQLTGVIIDVTEQKHAALELQARRRELAHLGRVATLGQLSGALAHELRQPLTAILINARTAQRLLAKRPPDIGEVQQILADIAQDDARAGEVIGRLRGLLKKGDPAFERLELGGVIEDSLEIVRGDVIERGVLVTRRLGAALPPVYGDRVELQQVLVNLVLNACEAMSTRPTTERRLTVGTTGDESGFVVAYVADRGPGIVVTDVERVFEPFVTSKDDGMGLGLSICRTIVTSHRGRLWAENNADIGATFYLALPTGPPS